MVRQSKLNKMEEWSRTNKLRFNIGKCHIIKIKIKQKQTNTQVLHQVTTVTDIGMQFEYKLKFGEHIEIIRKLF